MTALERLRRLQRRWRSNEWIDKHMAEIEPIDAIFTPQYACADELDPIIAQFEQEDVESARKAKAALEGK